MTYSEASIKYSIKYVKNSYYLLANQRIINIQRLLKSFSIRAITQNLYDPKKPEPTIKSDLTFQTSVLTNNEDPFYSEHHPAWIGWSEN